LSAWQVWYQLAVWGNKDIGLADLYRNLEPDHRLPARGGGGEQTPEDLRERYERSINSPDVINFVRSRFPGCELAG